MNYFDEENTVEQQVPDFVLFADEQGRRLVIHFDGQRAWF